MAPKKTATKRKSVIPAKTCGDCRSVILPTATYLRCDQCKESYHPICVQVDERVSRKLNRDNTAWLCPECEAEVNEDEEEDELDGDEIENSSMKAILAGIHKQLADLTHKCNDISSLKKQCTDISKSQQYLSDSHDNFIAQLKKCTDENKHMRNEITSLTTKCSLLSKELEQVKAQVNSHEQAKLSSNVLIRGIRLADDPQAAVHKIAALIEMQQELSKDITVKRITYPKRDPVLVVSFTDEQLKRKFVKEAKKKRISTQMFGYEGADKPVYVDEQLTRETFLLFKHAKELKTKGCKFVWIANGDIMIRTDESAPYIKITNKHQIDKIEKSLREAKRTDNKGERDKLLRSNANSKSTADNQHDKRSEKNEKKQTGKTKHTAEHSSDEYDDAN